MATGKLPSSMILRLPGGPLRARLDLTLAEWALLCRVDGHRPVAALASRSGRGHHDAVALAERLLAAGLLELAGEAGADGAGADDGQGGADDAGAPRQPGAVGTGADDRPDGGDGALAAAELAGLSSADAPGEDNQPAGAEGTAALPGLSSADALGEDNQPAGAELAGLASLHAPAGSEGDQPAGAEAAAEEGLTAGIGTTAGEDLASTVVPGLDDGAHGPGGLPGEAGFPTGDTSVGGDAGAEAEPAGVSAAGAPANGEAAAGRERIDPVSLLRELAAEAPAPTETPHAGGGEDLGELAAQLAGGGRPDGGRPGQPAGEDRGPRDEPARAPGRGASQAEFLREFASLARGGDPVDDPEPQPDEEPPDDERGRGRFGFRRGQRR